MAEHLFKGRVHSTARARRNLGAERAYWKRLRKNRAICPAISGTRSLSGHLRSAQSDRRGEAGVSCGATFACCGAGDLPVAGSTVRGLMAAAREAGADILLIGGVHKMSTLVQWAKIEAIDPKTERVLFDRLFTFRGDTDDAWRRAEVFIVGEITAVSRLPASR